MDVSFLVWALTIVGIIGLLLFDFFFHVRKAHVPTLREAAGWSAVYVGIALVFGVGVLVFGGTDDGRGVLRRLRHREGAVGRQPLRLPDHHDQLQGAARGPAEGAAVRHRVLADRPHRVHLPRRRADQLVRLGVLHLRADPAASPPATCCRPERLGQPRPATTSSSGSPGGSCPPPTDYDGDKLFTVERRQARHDADAAGHGRHRRHRHPVRAGLDPGDLRAHPERLHRLHRHRVLAARAAPAVLPHRRPAGPARLPVVRPRRDPRLHRRQARSCTPCTRTTSRSSTTASPSTSSRSAPGSR